MIHIVLVDDDLLALTKMKQLINLDQVKIVGEFTQPEQAIEYLKRGKVDILITDMRMPKMDGITLIRKMKDLHPELQVIAVSSYEDFQYVKESFREGSVDYILKHTLNEDTLTKVLMEAISHVSETNRSEPNVEILQESRYALKSRLVRQLLLNEISVTEAYNRFQKYQIQMNVTSTILVVCEIDDYRRMTEDFSAEDRSIFLTSVMDLMEKVLTKLPDKDIIRMDEGKYLLLFSYPHVRSQLYMYSTTRDYCKRLNYTLENMLNMKLSISIGRSCTDLEDFVACYQSCVVTLHNKFFQGKGQVYDAQHPLATDNISRINLSTRDQLNLESIYTALSKGEDSFHDSIEKIFKQYVDLKYPISLIELQLIDLLNLGYKVIKEQQMIKLQEDNPFNEMYQLIKKVETVDEMKGIVLAFYAKITENMSAIQHMQTVSYNKYTIQAIEQIKRLYTNNISLQDIADELDINATYLSKIFKADTALGFTEYLNRHRIEQAKHLIQSKKYRVKEIYGQVGFNQYNYFFKVFRQLTGLTPVEYEKQITK
ncbi:putative response regulatory protein [compost metagenome]